MALTRLTLLLCALLILTDGKAQTALPKNLNESIAYFQRRWTVAELADFKSKPEEGAVSELHFGTGLWIRNNWIYGRRDIALTNYFDSLGIYHPDDISSIILTSLHRTLNGKDIQLSEQVAEYQAYWKPVMDCHQKQKAQAFSVYNKFKESDRITIYMPVDTAGGSRNAVLYGCPYADWIFSAARDLVVKGTISKKYFINDSANVFFKVRIDSLNRNDVPILMEKVKPGDMKDFSLVGLTVE